MEKDRIQIFPTIHLNPYSPCLGISFSLSINLWLHYWNYLTHGKLLSLLSQRVKSRKIQRVEALENTLFRRNLLGRVLVSQCLYNARKKAFSWRLLGKRSFPDGFTGSHREFHPFCRQPLGIPRLFPTFLNRLKFTFTWQFVNPPEKSFPMLDGTTRGVRLFDHGEKIPVVFFVVLFQRFGCWEKSILF